MKPNCNKLHNYACCPSWRSIDRPTAVAIKLWAILEQNCFTINYSGKTILFDLNKFYSTLPDVLSKVEFYFYQ